jgi:antitoxin PrlF
MATNVTSKGRVTIPKAVRDHLGLVSGSSVNFKRAAGRQCCDRESGCDDATSRFAKLVGSAGPGPSTDEITALLRGD